MDNQTNGGFTSFDHYFDALRDKDRRYVLYYLTEHNVVNIEELARYVTALKTGQDVSSSTEDEYEHTLQDLHHKHLPRLSDYGFIDFDPRTGDVRFQRLPRSFEVLLWVSQLIEQQKK